MYTSQYHSLYSYVWRYIDIMYAESLEFIDKLTDNLSLFLGYFHLP